MESGNLIVERAQMKPMRLAFYRGTSWISRFIRWQTRGRYSHVAVLFDDESVIEAWHIGGVLHNANVGTRHDKGTVVDVYDVEGLDADIAWKVEGFLKKQLGKAYDFGSVFRFLSHEEKDFNPTEWFCSELVMEAFARAGFELLKIQPHKVSPEVLAWSPRLRKSTTLITRK